LDLYAIFGDWHTKLGETQISNSCFLQMGLQQLTVTLQLDSVAASFNDCASAGTRATTSYDFQTFSHYAQVFFILTPVFAYPGISYSSTSLTINQMNYKKNNHFRMFSMFYLNNFDPRALNRGQLGLSDYLF